MPDTSHPQPDQHNRVWRVGAATFDQQRRELRVGGQLRSIEAKPLLLLEVLLLHAGRVVSKEDLLATVWKDTNVTEQSINTAIGKLREALGAQGRAIVEAVRGEGYRIGLPIEIEAAPDLPKLAFTFRTGDPVPNRPQWRLDRALGGSAARDVWLAHHEKTGEQRVFKFADTAERLRALQREAALSRILHNALGDRPDLVRITEWSFKTRPAFLESPFGGESLPEWAEAQGGLAAIPLADRIAIVARIARTVAAAHDVGVLHRDIKPSNVLVSGAGANIAIRLVDFGSGRLTETARLEAVTVTGLGLTAAAAQDGERLSGTLRYMAPEVIAGGAPTIAADVYALGVILYQLVVCDLNRPLTIGCEAEMADPLLRQDVLKAAARNPHDRLPSAAILADRLERLQIRRVEASRKHKLEAEALRLARKLDRARLRRPWLLLAVASLALGLLGTGISAIRAARARDEAQQQSATVTAINQFLTEDIIGAADPDVSGKSDLTVASALRSAAAQIDGVLGNNRPKVRAALHAAMETAFTNLTDYNRALTEGERALAAAQAEREPDLATIADIQLRTADVLTSMGRLPAAGKRVDAAEQALAQLHPARADLSAWLWLEKGYLSGASMDLPNYIHDLQVASIVAQRVPDIPPRLRERILLYLGNAYDMVGRPSEGASILRRLLETEISEYGAEDARPNYVAAALANAYRKNRLDEAEALMKEALPKLERKLGPFARRAVRAKDVLAGIYFRESKFDVAAQLWSEVVAGYEHGGGDPAEVSHMGAQLNLAVAWIRSGRFEAAERILRALLDEQRGKIGAESPQAQSVRFNLAYVLLELHKPTEVVELRRGLTPQILNMSNQENDWPGRLMLTCAPTSLHSTVKSAVSARPILTVFFCSVKRRFSAPATILHAAARSLGQAWPKATGEAGAQRA